MVVSDDEAVASNMMLPGESSVAPLAGIVIETTGG